MKAPLIVHPSIPRVIVIRAATAVAWLKPHAPVEATESKFPRMRGRAEIVKSSAFDLSDGNHGTALYGKLFELGWRKECVVHQQRCVFGAEVSCALPVEL